MASGRDDPEMAEVALECHDEAVEIFRHAAEQEKEWAKYLFKDGSMIGLNYTILSKYVEYVTNLRLHAIGLPQLFPESRQNPIPWINTWLASDTVQVAPQEVEISSYLVGQIDSAVSKEEFTAFQL